MSWDTDCNVVFVFGESKPKATTPNPPPPKNMHTPLCCAMGVLSSNLISTFSHFPIIPSVSVTFICVLCDFIGQTTPLNGLCIKRDVKFYDSCLQWICSCWWFVYSWREFYNQMTHFLSEIRWSVLTIEVKMLLDVSERLVSILLMNKHALDKNFKTDFLWRKCKLCLLVDTSLPQWCCEWLP